MLTNKITGFSADLLNTVRGILGEAKKCPTDCECEKCEAEEMEEGHMPTSDEPTDANKKTADKVRALLAKEKKPVEEEKHGIPFKGPYKKVGDRKDEYGNVIKNVAKHLAKKAMNAQKNEELEHTNCGTPDCCGECDTVNQIDEAINFTAHDAIAKGHDGKTYTDIFNAHGSSIHNKIRAVRKERDENPNSKHARFLHTRMLGAYAAWYKNKKAVKEEVEELDEVSKATLGRYINKAKDSIDTASYRQGHKEAHGSSSKPLEKKLTKRHKGISTAVNKLTKEESEQIDELSKKTLNSYVIKSLAPSSQKSISNLASKGGYEHGAHGDTNPSAGEKEDAKSAKRSLGVLAAVRKLTKEEQDFIDALNDADMEQIDELSVVGLDKYHSKAYQSMFDKDSDKKTVAKRKKGMDMAYNKAGFGKAKVYASEEAELEEGEEKGGGYDGMPKGLQDRAPRGRARNAIGRAIARQERNLARARMDRAARKMEEEAEQVDEVSKNLMLRYVSANKKSDKAAQEKGDYSKSDRRMRGTDVAVRKYTATNNKYVRVPATEETEITEARGRPRKAGAKDFTIHPKTKEKLMHNNPEHMKKIEVLQKNGILEKPKVEAGQHIMNQLRKAKTSMLGGSKINFTHGDSKEVSGTHAAKILTKYAGMKPDEKENFQKFVGHSHENLMKHV